MEVSQADAGNRVPSVNRIAAMPFKPLIEVVGYELNQQIDFVGFKRTGRNPIDGKPAFGFLDVIFHAAVLVVEAPFVNRFPVQVGYNRFVFPIGIQKQARLVLLDDLGFTGHRHAPGMVPRSSLVLEGNALNDGFVPLAAWSWFPYTVSTVESKSRMSLEGR